MRGRGCWEEVDALGEVVKSGEVVDIRMTRRCICFSFARVPWQGERRCCGRVSCNGLVTTTDGSTSP